jgi:hypothetical protein
MKRFSASISLAATRGGSRARRRRC